VTWVKLDDRFPDHPKAQIGPVARDLFVTSLCYCNRMLTDGFVPERMVPKLADVTDTPKLATAEIVERLVSAGLWETAEGGFQVHDYHAYQPSRSSVERSREQARERMENIRRGSQDVRANNGESSPYPVPVPEPVPEASKKTAESDPGIERVIARIKDADETTLLTLDKLRRRGVPVAAFHSAYEALELRRGRKPRLDSEAKYFLGALNSMLAEGQYAVV
jgi:hypothetical protein